LAVFEFQHVDCLPFSGVSVSIFRVSEFNSGEYCSERRSSHSQILQHALEQNTVTLKTEAKCFFEM